MSYEIKQSSTAYPLMFLMVDSSDHITAKTGLSPTVTLSKAGGSFASPSGSVSEIGSGWYKVAGNATDSGTLGPLVLHATGTGADPVDVIYRVVAHDVQDAVHLGLSCLPNVASGSAGAIPTTGTGSNQINVSGGRADANVTYFNGSAGTFSSGRPEVNTTHLAGTSQTARDIGASVLISSGTGTGQLSVASGVIQSDIAKCGGSSVAAGAIPNVAAGSSGGLILIGTGTRDINPNAGGVVITSVGRDDIAASILDLADGIETGITPRQMLRAIGSMLAGIISGGGSGTEVFKAVNNSGTTRLTITVDSSGNRSSITYNL